MKNEGGFRNLAVQMLAVNDKIELSNFEIEMQKK